MLVLDLALVEMKLIFLEDVRLEVLGRTIRVIKDIGTVRERISWLLDVYILVGVGAQLRLGLVTQLGRLTRKVGPVSNRGYQGNPDYSKIDRLNIMKTSIY